MIEMFGVLYGVSMLAVLILLIGWRIVDRRRTGATLRTIRNARIDTHWRYGPGSDAEPGFVRCSMRADGIVVYDFALEYETFLRYSQNTANCAASIRHELSESGPKR